MNASTSTFTTDRLALAIYLHASGALPFSHVEQTAPNKVRFVYMDPDRAGDAAELAFDRGAEIAATNLFASQKYLRKKMSEALENRNIGESNRDHTRR